MKTCPNCNNVVNNDYADFCPNCGTSFAQNNGYTQNQNPNPNPNGYMPNQNIPPQSNFNPVYDNFDHTAEFDPKDISDNKVIAMLVYLMGTLGIILAALIGSNNSPYVAFHIRQSLKFTVVNILTILFTAVLCWTVIVPIVASVFMIILFILKIVCFFQICYGQAKEPAIIRSFGFLR